MNTYYKKSLTPKDVSSLTDDTDSIELSSKLKNPKAFPTEIVLSVYSDTALTSDMNKIVECIHHVFGVPLPLQLLNKKEVTYTCNNRIKNQVPNIAAAMDIIVAQQPINMDSIDRIKASLFKILGEEIILEKGNGEPDGWR